MPVRFVIALFAGASILTACGGGGDDSAKAPATNQTAAAPAATPRPAPVTVGGAPMYPNKTIIENASQSAEHRMLVRAVQAAGLAPTLSGAGPYTVFAPTDAAFGKLPAGTVDGLLRPEAKGQLTELLTYHVVPGVVMATDLRRAIQKGGGKAELATVAGGKLTASDAGGALVVTDEKGGQSRVTQGDVLQSNGVVHVVDAVLMPN